MPQAIWNGHISFSLVSIPVMLYSAETSYELHFKLLDNRNHAQIHYERVNEVTGEEVPWNEIVKGYEYDKGHFVILSDEDFKHAAIESSQTIAIENFVKQDEVDYIYFEKPYYLVPEKSGIKGYVILREALHRSKKIGIAKVVIRTRQYLAAVIPSGNALTLDLLRFYEEIRDVNEFDIPAGNFKTYKVTPQEIEMAQQLINTMTTKWNPKIYHDDYRDALMKWIEKKEKGAVIPKAAPQSKETAKVIDFMKLLQKSLEEKQKDKATHKKKHTPTAPRRKSK